MNSKGTKITNPESIYTLTVAITFIGCLSVLFTQIKWPETNALTDNIKLIINVFDIYFIECIFTIILGYYFVKQKKWPRIIAYFLLFLFYFSYIIQATSYYRTGEFITKLALNNINHIELVLNYILIIGAVISIILFTLIIITLEKSKKTKNLDYTTRKIKKNRQLKVFLSLAGVAVLVPSLIYPKINNSPKELYDEFLWDNRLPSLPPLAALTDTLFSRPSPIKAVSKNSLDTAREFKFYYNSESTYPLIKTKIYQSPPVFIPSTRIESHTLPNIIVFFTEGFSARNTDVYNSDYPDLTPNLERFANHANTMVIDNYFNHTAATYRGLHGQLCSLYPTYGGVGGWHDNYKNMPKTDYFCLPHLLKTHGYNTYFTTSQFSKATFLDKMLYAIGFDNVVMAENFLTGSILTEKPAKQIGLSDQQFFRGLIKLFKKHENKERKQPFFIGIYNLETHAFLDISKDGVAYGKGNNPSLNTIHNLDNSFGKFWHYFINSSYAKNTILIFTADHAHYYDKPFTQAFDRPSKFKRPYQHIFVDQIPLIIYDPIKKIPKTFDAHYATSIDFTPSLAHYLGLKNTCNAFMGHSIFGNRKNPNLGVASFGEETFIIDDHQIYKGITGRFYGKYKDKLNNLHQFMQNIHQLETDNRIWGQSSCSANIASNSERK